MSISDKNEVSQSATLAVMAGLITTLGDDLSTVAALAIQEAEQSSPAASNQDIEALQQQLRTLAKEVKKIKRVLNIT